MQPPTFNFPLAPKPKKIRPGLLTAMLAVKGVLDLLGLSLGVLTYVSLGSQADVTIPREHAQHMANVLLVGIVLSFFGLFGVLGTFSFKRWGVYVVVGFSALNVMAQLSAGNRWTGLIALAATAVIAAMVYPRWSDYE
ncbi:MAG TPA: hypothetical protein VLM85_30560 [Polyangiaceae bacterium]|nr:hypothetical protein [Polyangiaceae bacterium]